MLPGLFLSFGTPHGHAERRARSDTDPDPDPDPDSDSDSEADSDADAAPCPRRNPWPGTNPRPPCDGAASAASITGVWNGMAGAGALAMAPRPLDHQWLGPGRVVGTPPGAGPPGADAPEEKGTILVQTDPSGTIRTKSILDARGRRVVRRLETPKHGVNVTLAGAPPLQHVTQVEVEEPSGRGRLVAQHEEGTSTITYLRAEEPVMPPPIEALDEGAGVRPYVGADANSLVFQIALASLVIPEFEGVTSEDIGSISTSFGDSATLFLTQVSTRAHGTATVRLQIVQPRREPYNGRRVYLMFVDYASKREVAYESVSSVEVGKLHFKQVDANYARELVHAWRPKLDELKHLLWGTAVADPLMMAWRGLLRATLAVLYWAGHVLVTLDASIPPLELPGLGDALQAIRNDLSDVGDRTYWALSKFSGPTMKWWFISNLFVLFGARKLKQMVQERMQNVARKRMWYSAFLNFFRERDADQDWALPQRVRCMSGSNSILWADRVPWETADGQDIPKTGLELARWQCEIVQLNDGTCLSRADLLNAKQAAKAGGHLFNLYDRHPVSRQPYTRREKVLIGFLHALTPKSARLDGSEYSEGAPLPINGRWPSSEYCTPVGVDPEGSFGWALSILGSGFEEGKTLFLNNEALRDHLLLRSLLLERWPMVSELAKAANRQYMRDYYDHYLSGTLGHNPSGLTDHETLMRNNWKLHWATFEAWDDRYVGHLLAQEPWYVQFLSGSRYVRNDNEEVFPLGHLSLILKEGGF